MSSKQLVYLLMVLVVCCSVAGGIAHGQSTSTVTFKGTVLIDDSPAPGITITGANSAGIAGLIPSAESREDGSYTYGWLSFSGVVSAGDTFTFTLTDSGGNSQETAPYTLTAADTAVPFTVDLDLVPVSAGITVQSDLSAIPADGTSTSTITAMVRDDSGNPAAGDTVTISADKGTVGATTDNGDGTYTATYTAPSLALAASDTAQISAASAQLGETAMTSITLTPIPTTVTVTVEPSIFSADTLGTGTVTISVDRAGPVADETVTISAPTVGTASAVTNNGDGTYSATYTSGAIAGRVTLTATATQANESGSAIITISAGAPAEVTVSAVPTGVSSGGSSIITAMVSDSSGNALSAQSLTAETSSGSGTITEFTESSVRPGSYSATYTAPVVTAEGTETITVTVGTASGQATLQLTPVPPVEVGILDVEGTVFMADGVTAAAGVDVEIMVGSNTAMATTDADGYFVTFLDLLAPVARGGDPVSIVVTDANGGTHGPYTSVLSNDELGEGGTATVRRDVTTDIPVPPRTVNILVVNGIVYTIDGETPAEGVNVAVTVGSNALAMTTTDMNGFFERTAVGLDTPAASTGDMVSIVVTDDTGVERGAAELTLTSADLGTTGSATVTQNVMTDIVLPPMSVDILVVDGVVYRDDMMTPVDSGFDVTVTVGADESQTTSTDAAGSFSVTFLEIPPMTVATTGDMVSIIVTDSTGTQRGPGDQFTLTHIKLADPTVTRKVYTDIGATSKLLNVVGTVYLKDGDGDPVAAARHLRQTELTVVVANSVRNLPPQRVPVDDNGEYAAVLIELLDIAAETGDSLTVAVEDEAGVTVGEMAHTLTTPEVQAAQAEVNVHTNVPAKVGVLSLVGSVVELDGTAAGAGLQVTITLAMDGQTMPPVQVSTDASGGYEYTFFDPPATIASTGDVLMVDVLRSVDGYHGHAEIDPLRSIEIIYRNQPLVVDPIKMLPPIKALGGLSINPQYVPEELKRISREAIQTNPVLLEMIPSGILYLDLMKGQLASLPAGFDPTNDAISKANFGNAIAPKPMWHVLGQDSPTDPNRWLNGDLLNLYVLTGPTADSVMFTLSGAQSGRASATRIATGDTVPYTFQLEEERAVLFLPSWGGLNEGMSVFASVDLVIDGDAGIPMTQNMDTGIWEAEAQLMPGSKVYYHYRVRLALSYEVDGRTVENWVVPDPRNLQVEDRGIVESLLAPELGPDLVEIVTTTNLQLRSVLNVPAANALQSLWVQTFDLTGSPDGMYQLDTVITHADTVITTDSDYVTYVETIGTQAFMVDRSAPTADLALAIAESSGMYQNPDGSYVAAAHTDGGTLTITATPTGDPMDPGAYLYQIISLDAAGNPGVNVWNPAILTTDLALTYMDPHQVTLPLSGENSLLGNFGLRAVGINDILNISSSTAPIMLEVVPLEYDNAAVTVVHADYNGDGTTDGRFESVQHVSDGVTIFSDRSAVTLTLEITERTKHPLTSIAVDFQIDGAGDWMPIHVFDADALTDVAMGSELTVSWDRTEDFAGLLDMRGQATVRVTVANALDAVSTDSMATFEIVPPALQLGGLSINTSYEAGLNALAALQGLDVTGLATSLLGMDPSALISPSPLPVALALLGVLGHVQSALPAGFEVTDEQIHRENFGNAITPKPIWSFMASADQQDSGRWLNGNQLSLYTFAGPTAQSLTFSATGAGTATATASKVAAGGSFMYNFQLEEELVAIFAGSMPAFAAVTLMIDGQAPIAMVGNAGVWSAEAALTPGYTVSYYYRVELAQPYHDPINQLTITAFPLPDPRNLQMAETANLLGTIEMLLTSELNPLATMDPGLRSVFRVPAVDDDSQSLWVGKLDLPADGMYQLDVAVGYSGGSADALTGKMFTVDTTAPTADTMVHDTSDDNIGMYLRDADGTYVATALPDLGKAILNVSATPIDDSDLEAYLYQFARLDDAGNPGTWNPMLTVDLQGLDIVKLLTNPASVLPLTSRPPHHVQMLVRSETGNDLDYGTYGLRVVGIDNILNADSGRAAGVVLELVSPDPDSAMISLVQTDYDGNGTTDGPYETQSTAGEVTIFSDSMVTLTVDIIERSDHPLTIELEYQIAGGDWHPIGTLSQADLVNAMEGDQLTVNWDVGDYAALPNLTGEVMVRTVATNALTIRRQTDATFTYQRRLAPAINAIHVEAADLHPDSGAARDGITISAFTQAMTNPVTTAVEFEVRRSQGTDWVPVGAAQLAGTTVVSQVQIAIIEDLVGAVVGGAASAPIAPFYRQWSISVDTTTLEDTILDDTPAASDANQDDNPYIVRAAAIDVGGAGYPSAAGVKDEFSVDNYSPTEIIEVANEVEVVAPREVEAGQVSGNGPYYHVSGLLLEGVPDPMLTLTARTGAYPGVFPGGIKLAITDASSGATLGVDTVFEDAGNYTYKGVVNLASLPNGIYNLMAVAHAADGSPETRIDAMPIIVEVRNFTPPENFADPSVDILSIIDTEGDARSPSEIDAMYPIGFPTIDDKLTFTLTVSNVDADEIDVLIGDDERSARMLGALTDDGIMITVNADGSISFEIMLDTSMLDEGPFDLTGTVTKPNGTARFGLPVIRVDRSAPVVEIVSPVSRHQIDVLPAIQITYTDASGFDPNDMAMNPMPVEITLTRLPGGEAINVDVSRIRITAATVGEILSQSGNIVYTHDYDLAGGAYRIEAMVTDILGNVGTAEPVEFTVESVRPTVSIVSPLIGVIVDPKQPLIISADLTGDGEITVTEFQINGTDIEGTLEGDRLTYTMEPPLVAAADSILQRGSDNTISVKIVDSEGRTAEGAISFAVSLEDPTVSITSPLIGQVVDPRQPLIVSADLTGDGEVMVTEFQINGTDIEGTLEGDRLTYTMEPPLVAAADSILQRGSDNTISIKIVDSQGLTAEGAISFAVSLEDPTVSITSPLIGQVVDPRQPLIVSADLTGDGEITVTEFQINGTDIEGTLEGDRLTYTMEPPLVAAADSILRRGSDNTISIKIVDSQGLTAEGAISFAVSLEDPTVSITSPLIGQVVDPRQPLIVSADLTGDGEITVTEFQINGMDMEGTLEGDRLTYTMEPPLVAAADSILRRGSDNTISIKIVDSQGLTAEGAISFAVSLEDPTVSITSPLVGQVVDPRQPLIVSADLTGDGEITVTEFQINGMDMEGTLEGDRLTYTMEPPLVAAADSILRRGSDNTISIKIVDSQGLTAEGAISFAVSLEDPTVSITSPLVGQVVDPRQPLIVSADLTGDGEITVTEFQINGTDIEGTLEGDRLTYTMEPPLVAAADSILQRGSDNTISIKIVDSQGLTAEGAISFAVSLEDPTVSITSPLIGQVVDPRQPLIVSADLTGDGEITVTEFQINGMDMEGTLEGDRLTYTMEPPLVAAADSILRRGSDNTISIKIVDSQGLTAEGAVSFAVSLEDPTVSITSPLVGQVVDPRQPLIVSADLTGDGEITVTEFQINGMDMEGTLEGNRLTYMMEPPLVAAADSILRRGSDNTISIKIVDSQGLTAEGAVSFAVSLEDPTVSITSPLVGQVVDPRQPLIISADLTGDGEITVTEFQINGTDMEGTLEGNRLTYTMEPPLIDAADSILRRGSDNTISIKIVDSQGLTAEGAVSFAVTIAKPTVTIITPAPGQVVDADQPLIISAALSGSGEITVDQLLINGGTYTPQSVKGNLLTHIIQPPFGVLFKRGSGNRITIKIVDEEGNTAEATSNFAISKDVTPPVVATYSPLGIIRTDRPIAAATVTDASGINTRSLTIIIAGVPGNQGTGRRSSPTSTTVTFTPSISVTPGPYTARVTVEDVHGNRTEAEWQFTVELDVTPPSITISSPHGVIRSDKPIISVSASDDMSGVDTIEIGVKGEGNQTVAGVTSVRSDKTSATFTPAASLTSGTYTVDVKLADMRGNKASGQWQFTVELDTIPPAITITRPMQEHTENRRPIISASYTDVLSGVDAESVKISLDGSAIEPDAVSETQVMFTPEFDLTFGQHTVKLEVSDLAPSANTAVQEWSFFVERMGIANVRNYPNPFEDDTTIAFRISRQASITVQIYDFTGRLVAEPISNSVREAGPVEIPWDGQTNAGDSLARGVYFCHILMESELEPQSTILKMAIISD